MTEIIEQMGMYVKAYKKANRELDELEVRADDVRTRYDEIYAERSSLQDQLRQHERSIGALESQREDLKGDHAEATFEGDQQELQRISKEKKHIDQSLNQHHQEIYAVRESLAALSTGELETEAATVSVAVDRCIADVPVLFGMLYAPTNVARNGLNSRADTIKSNLPEFSDELYRKVRSEQDEEYRQQLEREQAERARQQRVQAEKAERSRLTKSAVVNQDTGFLEGYEIKDEQGNVVDFQKAKRVPIAQ